MRNSLTRFYGAAGGSMGLPGLYARNHTGRPAYEEGDGGGEGAAGGTGEGGGEGAGEGGGVQPHEFTDENAMVRIPGLKDPIKVADLKAAYGLQGQHSASMKVMGQIAAALQKNQTQQQPKPGQQQQNRGNPGGQGGQQQNKDAISQLEALDIIDGKTAAAMMRQMETGTLAPMAKALIALADQVKQLQGHVGRHVGSEIEGNFGREIDSVVKSLKLPAPADKIAGSEVISEMVRDFYHSFDENSQKQLSGEKLSSEFKPRFDAMRKFFRELEKSELSAAQERAKQRIFAKPGAGSSANGKGQKRMSNHDVAQVFFGSSNANAEA